MSSTQVDLRRLLAGLYGLALLRGWPFDDPSRSETQLDAIRRVLERPPEFFPIEDSGLEAAYALWSETYDEFTNALIDAEEPVVRSLLDELPAGRALDAACGTGRLTRLLEELGHDVVAVDASAAMLARAREKGLRARLVTGNLLDLPMESGSIDVAVCGLALTHVEDLLSAVAELARVLRPGGLLLTTDVHPVAAATGAHAFFTAADGSRGVARNHVHWPSAYMAAFREAGLRVERLEEILVDEAFIAEIKMPDVRDADEEAVLGLPLAIVWAARKAA
jgi:ubiquinone/menaquinone biosynthesis C-methylase UbiE